MSKNGSSSCRFCGRKQKSCHSSVNWRNRAWKLPSSWPLGQLLRSCWVFFFFYFSFFGGVELILRAPHRHRPQHRNWNPSETNSGGCRCRCICEYTYLHLHHPDSRISRHLSMQNFVMLISAICMHNGKYGQQPPVHMSVHISAHPSISCTTNASTLGETDWSKYDQAPKNHAKTLLSIFHSAYCRRPLSMGVARCNGYSYIHQIQRQNRGICFVHCRIQICRLEFLYLPMLVRLLRVWEVGKSGKGVVGKHTRASRPVQIQIRIQRH